MEYHYKAFISYRHDPADSRIAAEIQTQVERYRLPYSVRKEKGIKSVGTVFRDKEELSAGSDLNENIQWALLHSEYLIVICSKRLKDSLWCQKEIEFFLAHRDHRHVTTVLVDGEPQDVIPKILQEEKILTEDADGNPVEVTVPLEPLSCDYRMPIRRARREELPRLIAVLTGIRYGELMQRQKKRQRRLLAAAAATAAVLIAYLSWSLVNIRAGYRRTQISESLSMADDALKSIEDNNHLEALKTSLGAVPTQEAPRPFVPEAQYALSRSLHSYEAPSYISSSDVARFEFDGRNYTIINVRALAAQGSTLYVATSEHVFVCKDSHFEPLLISPGIIVDIILDDGNNLLYISTQDKGGIIYDIASGSYIKNEFIEPSASAEVLRAFERNGVHCFMYRIENDTLICYYSELTSNVMRSFAEVRKNSYKKPFVRLEHLSEMADGCAVYFTTTGPYEELYPVKCAVEKIAGVDHAFYLDVYNGAWYLEVFSDKASKAAGIGFLREKYGFDKVVAFGDNLNDLPMFSRADVRVAVKNARPEVIAAADLTAPSNSEDGVAMWLLENSMLYNNSI